MNPAHASQSKKYFDSSSPIIRTGVILFFLMGFHFFRVASMIPVRAWLSDDPFLTKNYAHDTARILRDQAMRKAAGRSWGYDPMQMMGFPAGNTLEKESQATIILARVFESFLSAASFLKIYVFFSYWLAPLLIYFSVLLLSGREITALSSLALSIAGFAGFDALSSSLVMSGNHDFLLANYSAILAFCAYYSGLTRQNSKIIIFSGALYFLTGILNIFVLLVSLPCLLLITIFFYRKLERNIHIVLGIVLILLLVSLWQFYLPFRMMNLYLFPFSTAPVGFAEAFKIFFGFDKESGNVFGAILRVGVLASALGWIKIARKKTPVLSELFAFWMWALLLLVLLGSQEKFMAEFIPKRFIVTFSILQAIPAGFFLTDKTLINKIWKRGLAAGVLLTGLAVGGMNSQKIGALPSGIPTQAQAAVDQLKNLPHDGRVLWENSSSDERLGDLLPFLTGQAFIGPPGGPYARFKQFTATEFLGGSATKSPRLFGRALPEYSYAYLRSFLELDNVHYVAVYSLQAKGWMSLYSKHFHLLGDSSVGPNDYQVYEMMNWKPTYLLKGSGNVHADYDKIIIDHPSQGELILKFRWFYNLVGPAGVRLEPLKGNQDPDSLLQVFNQTNLDQIIISSYK